MKNKKEKELLKELKEVDEHIDFLKHFIANLRKNILADGVRYRELSLSEINNDKQRWIDNNMIQLVNHLEIKITILLKLETTRAFYKLKEDS